MKNAICAYLHSVMIQRDKCRRYKYNNSLKVKSVDGGTIAQHITD
jgi:hypothetical protein